MNEDLQQKYIEVSGRFVDVLINRLEKEEFMGADYASIADTLGEFLASASHAKIGNELLTELHSQARKF